MGIVLGVVGRGHLDPGELRTGGAEFVHVAHRDHGVHVDDAGPERRLEAVVGGRAAPGTHTVVFLGVGTRSASQRDQRHLAMAGGDRLCRVAHMEYIGRTAGLGAVDLAQLQAHVLGLVDAAHAGHVARAVVGVDVVLVQTGVVERALGDLGVQLRHGFAGALAQRVLVDARDVGLAFDAHATSFSVGFLAHGAVTGVDHQFSAVHVFGFVGREIEHTVGDVAGFAEFAER